jgi:PTS system galactitol-specific IIB component
MSDKKKRILIACGSGIVTSTIARKKIEELLDTHGYKGRYEIVQVPLSTASKKSKDCDFIVATAIKPSELHCPFVDGTPLPHGAPRGRGQQADPSPHGEVGHKRLPRATIPIGQE